MYRKPYEGSQFPNYKDSKIISAQEKRDVQEIIGRFRSQNESIYRELEGFGLNRELMDNILLFMVTFLIDQADISGTPQQIYNQFQDQYPWFNFMIRQVNIPRNIADRYILRIIEILTRLI